MRRRPAMPVVATRSRSRERRTRPRPPTLASICLMIPPCRPRDGRHELQHKETPMFIDRRRIVLGTAAIAAATCLPRVVFAQAAAGPFRLDPLAYPTNALEPHIDAKTMEI